MSTETSVPLLPIHQAPTRTPVDRERLVRRARLLARASLIWHLFEAAVAIILGILATSIALTGFGADSLIEAAAGLIVLWLMTDHRSASPRAERRAQQLIAGSFLLLTAYLTVQSIADLAGGDHPSVSWPGIVLSIVTLLAMPPLAAAKRRVGRALGSPATTSESQQTMLCAYLSAALLTGLLANALAGWWWADPLVALTIAGLALHEARGAWRGTSCNCC